MFFLQWKPFIEEFFAKLLWPKTVNKVIKTQFQQWKSVILQILLKLLWWKTCIQVFIVMFLQQKDVLLQIILKNKNILKTFIKVIIPKFLKWKKCYFTDFFSSIIFAYIVEVQCKTFRSSQIHTLNVNTNTANSSHSFIKYNGEI